MEKLNKLGGSIDENAFSLARNVWTAIHTDSPHCLGRNPRETHPIFYGCYDWHSAVHSHWTLLQLTRMLTSSTEDDQARFIADVSNYFLSQFTEAQVMEELRGIQFLTRDDPTWECPYGFSWFIKFYADLSHHEDWFSNVSLVRHNLSTLLGDIIVRFVEYLRHISVPNRIGAHDNTAFALQMILEVGFENSINSNGFYELLELAKSKSLEFFEQDIKIREDNTIKGFPFLSPALCEALLMVYLFSNEGATGNLYVWKWLERAIDQSVWDLTPIERGNPEDPYGSHLCGLNFSRSHNFSVIADCMLSISPVDLEANENKKRVDFFQSLVQSSTRHYRASVQYLASGHFMGDHWLASFAIRARNSLLKLSRTIQTCRLDWIGMEEDKQRILSMLEEIK